MLYAFIVASLLGSLARAARDALGQLAFFIVKLFWESMCSVDASSGTNGANSAFMLKTDTGLTWATLNDALGLSGFANELVELRFDTSILLPVVHFKLGLTELHATSSLSSRRHSESPRGGLRGYRTCAGRSDGDPSKKCLRSCMFIFNVNKWIDRSMFMGNRIHYVYTAPLRFDPTTLSAPLSFCGKVPFSRQVHRLQS